MTEYYDIVLSSPFPNYHFFAHKMRELCGQQNLSFYLVNDLWVNEFYQKLQSRELGVRVMLDLTANQTIEDDPYLMLAKEVKRQGGYVIDDPDVTANSAHKGRFHNMLVEQRIPVPDTIMVSRDELPTFKISDEIRERMGVPFVVKPAWGDSGVGVVVDAESEDALHLSAEQTPNSDTFLIQKWLYPQDIGSHVGWFRMFHICREVIPCWWNPVTHEYQLVTPAQIKNYKLAPLRQIMRGIARASKMKKFTSEICLHEDGKFYAIDYVDADPDMNPRSFYPNGVPDEVVRHIVWLLFYECMHLVKRGHGFFDDELVESESGLNWLEQRQREQRGIRGYNSTRPEPPSRDVESLGLYRRPIVGNRGDCIRLVPGAGHVNTSRRNWAACVRRVADIFEEHIA